MQAGIHFSDLAYHSLTHIAPLPNPSPACGRGAFMASHLPANSMNLTTSAANLNASGVNVAQAPSPALRRCRAGEGASATSKAL